MTEARVGQTPSPSTASLAAFIDQVHLEANTIAESLGGWETRWAEIGGLAVRVRSAGIAANAIAQAFRAVPEPANGIDASALRLDFISTDDSVGTQPAPAWGWRQDYYSADHLSCGFNGVRRVLTTIDESQGAAVAWFGTPVIAAWEYSAPARAQLARLLFARGATLLHAGAIGRDGAALVLPAPGGSGKSSTVELALEHGFDTVGDDFLAATATPVPSVSSIYQTLRLGRSSPRFRSDKHVVLDDGFQNDKALVYLDKAHPGRLVDRQKILAFVVPTLTGRLGSQIVSASRMEVLRAMVPSSLFIALNRQPAAMKALVDLTRTIPSYRFELGTEPSGILDALKGLLDELHPK